MVLNNGTSLVLFLGDDLYGFYFLKIPAKQETVYGKRDGALTGIAICHQDRSNIYKKSALWKTGVIMDVSMLERAAMFKPEAINKQNLLHCGVKFVCSFVGNFPNIPPRKLSSLACRSFFKERRTCPTWDVH